MDDPIVSIEIFGHKFNIKSTDGSKSELIKISEYYKGVIQDMSDKHPNFSHIQLFCLSGLKIAEEFYSFAKKKDSTNLFDRNLINEKVNEAIKLLDISLDS